MALRKTLLLSLDDRLVVTRESSSTPRSPAPVRTAVCAATGLPTSRALLPKEEGAQTPVKTFKAYEPGFVHVDINYLPQMSDADRRTYLFAAIDRATRWVCPWRFSNLRRRLPQAPDRQGSLHHQQGPHRQWQGVYRPLLRYRQTFADRRLPSIGSAPITVSNTA